jgi:hypothetical protein
MADDKLYGVLAEFPNPKALFDACEQVRDQGFRNWDAHTPYPVHGLDGAMGLAPSSVPWIALVSGLSGAAGGFLLQTWVSVSAWPLVISGKPLFSWQAFVPVTFECGVLAAALGAIVGMLYLNRLPMHHNPLFESSRFEAASDDKFFISIEATDPSFDADQTGSFLQGLGASHVELVKE